MTKEITAPLYLAFMASVWATGLFFVWRTAFTKRREGERQFDEFLRNYAIGSSSKGRSFSDIQYGFGSA